VFERFRASEDAAASGVFWREGFGEISKASAPRVERLIAIAGEKDREFEIPGDSSVYGEIAERSIEARGMPENGPPLQRDSRLRALFHCDAGAIERYPTRSFVERITRELRLEGPAPAAAYAAPGLETFISETRGGSGEPQDLVFLLNRGPVDEAAVQRICATASVVVVAGWPYAERFVHSGAAVLVTYGLYDAAADVLCRRLIGSLSMGS